MDAFALSAGARATETLSSIKVGKVLVLAAQKRLKVYLKKVSRVGMGYDFGKNGLSEGVLLVEPHFLLSEIIILFKVGIFELKIVHPVDSWDSLIQGVWNRVKIDSFILGVIFLLGENFALEDDFLSWDFQGSRSDLSLEVFLIGTLSGVINKSLSVNVESINNSGFYDRFIFGLLLGFHYKNEYQRNFIKSLSKNDGESSPFEFPL